MFPTVKPGDCRRELEKTNSVTILMPHYPILKGKVHIPVTARCFKKIKMKNYSQISGQENLSQKNTVQTQEFAAANTMF